MSEGYLQWITIMKAIWCVCFATLYSLGGMTDKRIRRIGDAILAMGAVSIFATLAGSFSWYLLTIGPLLWGALSIGYGVNDGNTWKKVLKRGRYGLACCLAWISCPILVGTWDLYFYYIALVTLSCVFLGVVNPCKNARDEENLIALMISTGIFLI